jgi:hypothetical protein
VTVWINFLPHAIDGDAVRLNFELQRQC